MISHLVYLNFMNPLTRKYEDFVKMKKETTEVASEFFNLFRLYYDFLKNFQQMIPPMTTITATPTPM